MIINKITAGFVIQSFDTDAKAWVKQEFVAGDECDYEVNESPLSLTDIRVILGSQEPYLPFDMVQPSPKIMSKIYMIAEDVWVRDDDGEETVETRACHNFGFFRLECDAQRKCDALNARTQEGSYYVKGVAVP